VEFLDHSYLRNVRNVIPHSLEKFQERAEGLVTLALDGFGVPRLRRFVGKGLKIRDKPIPEVGLVIDAVAGKVSEPL
jgi:hypothetical protein